MQRIDTTNRQLNKFGAGKDGFQDGDPATNVDATYLDAAWCDALQEEIANVIEFDGTALNPADRTQLITRLRAMFSLAAAAGLGYLQTWQDVKVSRAVGTTYYNTTGRTIKVSCTAGVNSSGTTSLSAHVGGATAETVLAVYATTQPLLSFEVPAGASYSISLDSGPTVSVNGWYELR